MALEQVSIFVKGIVQGVGFRPFVFRLADELKLTGTVLNDHRGVSIVLQGEPPSINQFIYQLEHNPPPLARVDSINSEYQMVDHLLEDFHIIESQKGTESAIVALSADKSTCADCLNDMADPHNHHYMYPFTNCTNCGPRYSIINALPYDRHNTSMAKFNMCSQCEAEYTNPLNRRYHAQPVSCPDCGPQLKLMIVNQQVNRPNLVKQKAPYSQAISEAVALINQGYILAIKGLGGFHLVCDATQDNVVNKLRSRKKRPAKPLAIMVADIEQAKSLVTGSEAEWNLLQSAERPIVVMDKKNQAYQHKWQISESVAPGIDRLGVFLPYTPLHHLLMAKLQRPIVATSANKSGEPIIGDSQILKADLGHVVDAVLDHDRPIINACDDSVVQLIEDELQVIRLARGYAPLTLTNNNPILDKQQFLAVGGQQKNTVAYGFKGNLILSPHIGDLFTLPAQEYFHRSLATFKRLYDVKPHFIITDKHPDYAPTRWAADYQQQHTNITLQPIQHHYGHVLAIMAANNITDTVLGFSYDGTGLGDNYQLWGSEVMLANSQEYKIIAHFSEYKLIGAEQAIKQPVRILLSLLFSHFTLDDIQQLPIPAIQKLTHNELSNLYNLWKKPQHGIYCRSVGRLFDALAVALNLIETNEFEGQAGMIIEAYAKQAPNAAQQPKPSKAALYLSHNNIEQTDELDDSATIVWDSQHLFKQIITTISTQLNTPALTEQLCQQFITVLQDGIAEISRKHPEKPHVFSGGVFQNKLLLQGCIQFCKSNQRSYLSSHQVPINDGGLALGQLWAGIHNPHR
ncbi:carbamoyltransferase HypF [Shewanella gaetbuli]